VQVQQGNHRGRPGKSKFDMELGQDKHWFFDLQRAEHPLLFSLALCRSRSSLVKVAIDRRRYTYLNPYTSSSPSGFGVFTRLCPVEMYTFPLATMGEVNLIPYPGTSADFVALLYSSSARFSAL
jgi:hypothetical protein